MLARKSLLLVACFWCLGGKRTGALRDDHQRQPEETAELVRALNEYLSSFRPEPLDANSLLGHLEEASRTIESLGAETLLQMSAEQLQSSGLASLASLLGRQPQVLLGVLGELLRTPKSCDQQSTSLLMLLLSEHERRQEPLEPLQALARSLLDNCYHSHLSTLGLHIRRLLGKTKLSLSSFLVRLANRLENSRLERRSKATGKVTIRDSEPPSSPSELGKLLKGLHSAELRELAAALVEELESELPAGGKAKPSKEEEEELSYFYQERLVSPCGHFVSKLNSLLAPLEHYQNFLPGRKESLRVLLESLRAEDSEVDYQLDIFNICQKLLASERQLWRFLSVSRRDFRHKGAAR